MHKNLNNLALFFVVGASTALAFESAPCRMEGGFCHTPSRAASSPPLPALTLVWQDVQGLVPPGPLLEGVEREVASLFAEIGVSLTWRNGGVVEGGPNVFPIEVQVILLSKHPTLQRTHVMGECLVRQETPRTAWVYMDSIKQMLHTAAFGWEVDSRWLVIALARVTVHEVVHAIADLPHTKQGLMRASLERQDLLENGGRWDRESATGIIKRLTTGYPVETVRSTIRTVRAGER